MTPMKAAILWAACAGAALAEGGMTVQLPDTAALPQDQAQGLLTALAQVNVITSNCPGYGLTDGEWTLVAGTGDRLAAQLGLDASAYDRDYYAPAFRLLDDAAACDRIGPTAAPLIARLKGMGGGTAPLDRSQ